MSLYGTPRYKVSHAAPRPRAERPSTGAAFWESHDSKNHRGQLTDPAQIRAFVVGGRATITLESVATGTHFTYTIKRAPDNDKLFFVAVRTGAEAETSYLGLISNGRYRQTAKSRISATAPSARAFEWFSRAIHQPELPAALRVWHEGRCAACGRALTVPASVATGFGPECSARLGIDWKVPTCEAVAA